MVVVGTGLGHHVGGVEGKEGIEAELGRRISIEVSDQSVSGLG